VQIRFVCTRGLAFH